MAMYTIRLEQFHIDTTRSRHNDTDTGTFSAHIGTHSYPVQPFNAGDVNNGDHPLNLVVGPVGVSQPGTVLAFSYSIYNGDASKLSVALPDLTNDLAGKAWEFLQGKDPEQADLSDFTDYPGDNEPDTGELNFEDTSWVQVLEYLALGSFLFPDCDGFVVIGTMGRFRVVWDRLIDAAGGSTYRQTIRYPGQKSPAGCGSNSDYSVTWSVTRQRASGPGPLSLRSFLSAQRLALRPGVASLAPGESHVSLRGLLT